jgi:tetratricopeptide (TPR) repeat protein
MKTKRSIIIFFAIGLFFTGYSFSENHQWLDSWQYRKIVEIPVVKNPLPVEEAALIELFGKAKEDGSDIRVFTNTGEEVPLFIVSAGPDNRYRVTFPVKGGRYFIYYGNLGVQKTAHNWQPQRGLLLEVYERQGDDVSSIESVKSIIEKSKKGTLIGRDFCEKIWDGTNPFGPQTDVVRVYTGYFYVAREQRNFTFGTSSAGPSYLLIDDKIVASWPGWHPAEPFVRPEHTGTVNLKKGLHKLTYYHIGRRYQEISVAAIKREDNNKFAVIPEKFFLPFSKAEVVKTEKMGKDIAAEFGWENTHYLRREGWELLTFRFFDTSFPDTRIDKITWSFGDGQSSSGKEVYHTYLKKGTYPVSLKIKDVKGNMDETILQVLVEQDYSIMRLPSRTHQQYIEEFCNFNYNHLDNESLFILADLYQSYDRIQDAYKVHRTLESRKLSADKREKVLTVSAVLAEKTGDYRYAEEVYKKMIKNSPSPEIMLKLGNLYLETNRLSEAEIQYNRILQTKDVPKNILRKSEIGLGDVYRAKGDYFRTSAIYEKLTTTENAVAREGIYAQSVIYYLRLNDFSTAIEKLLLWADEIPSAKINGQWSVLMARALIIKKDHKKALRELETFRGICRDIETNPYYGWGLYLMGEAYEGIGDKTKASDAYTEVIEKFPGSQLYELAVKKISSITK